MYSDNNPPEEKIAAEFPVLDSVVTVENCWYYLSLLERFVTITSRMSKETLKIYLVRAEYRYFRWISNKGSRIAKYTLPPLDVAFFWQAHMLSPFRFYEDSLRIPPYQTYCALPLKEIHDFQTSRDTNVLVEWKKHMNGEDYDLTEEVIEKDEGCASVRCVVCNMRMESPWKEYAEWRTDHSVALQCHCCYTMFTVKHVGKANFLADNARVRSTAGLLLSESGLKISSELEHALLYPIKDIKSLPFNEGLKPLEKILKQRVISGFYNRGNFLQTKNNIVNAIQSTYLCTPYRASSIDMIQAVARQYKFAVKVTKAINWNAPDGIVKGIRHYSGFLAVIHDNNSIVAVPTYEIDLAWHTHMLHPKNYRAFCMKVFKRLINHDDTIPEEKLKDHVEQTDIAWKQRKDRREFSKLPTLPTSRPSSPTAYEIEKEKTDMKLEKLEEENKAEKIKKGSFKKKISRLMSFKKKKEEPVKKSFAYQPTPSYKNYDSPPITTESIYMDEKLLLGTSYYEGAYKLSEPYQYVSESISPVEIEYEQEYQDGQKETNGKASENRNDCGGEEFTYDKENISFHDRRDIKDFVKLKNSDSLMDSKFEEIKKSAYGFIGTSNCGNTEILDQWDENIRDNKEKEDNNDKKLTDPPISRYKKVFVTRGKIPVYSPKGLANVPKLENSENVKYKVEYASRGNRYNAAGTDFNWYDISTMWYNSLIDRTYKASGDCGGFSNCGNHNSTKSRCAGITSTCGTDNSSAGHTTSSNNHHNSSSRGGSSSCGGSSSSCSGSSSSCGGSSSSCGGGGGGSSCGSC